MDHQNLPEKQAFDIYYIVIFLNCSYSSDSKVDPRTEIIHNFQWQGSLNICIKIKRKELIYGDWKNPLVSPIIYK